MDTKPAQFSWNKADWTPISVMAAGFDEYRPAHSEALAGRTIVLDAHFIDTDERFTCIHSFEADKVDWVMGGERGADSYELFEMQPGLFYLHYLRAGADHPVVISAAIDTTNGQVTGAVGELGLAPDPHLARQRWFQGQIQGSGATSDGSHRVTDELIGRRVRYAYASDEVYDHIYLNENIFTWLCVDGSEAGVGDTERCSYWKLRDETYLFSWLEKNLGVEGMVLIDLRAHRTVGIQFALDQHSGELVNITMGAHAIEFERTPSVSDARPAPAVH